MSEQKRIEEIDPNLAVSDSLTQKDQCLYDATQAPFRLYGFCENMDRMPKEAAISVNEGVAELYRNTAGGRVRFSTDSDLIAIKAKMPSICRFAHMPLTGTSGFDLYVKEDGQERYAHTFVPPIEMTDGYESEFLFSDRKLRDCILYFPLYNSVDQLQIGLRGDAILQEGGTYREPLPTVYYGSSITQGGCASRPGNAYQAFICRWMDADFCNLGFSGNARGEQAMADYIAGLSMRVLVLDYDHNAPDAQHLSDTYAAFYQTIRKAQPFLPVIMVSRPDFEFDVEDSIRRRAIIEQVYTQAKARGENVVFVDGQTLFGQRGRDGCTVDHCHPNDLGFYRMAERLEEILKKFNQS